MTPEPFWTARIQAILPCVEHGSLEYFRWFYAGRLDRPGEMEERWHEDLVIHQSPDIPDAEGTFQGYQGLSAMNRELQESWENVVWEPQQAEPLGGDRYLVLLKPSARGRGSGIEMEGEIAHIVTLREGRAACLDTYLSWNAARGAAGLG